MGNGIGRNADRQDERNRYLDAQRELEPGYQPELLLERHLRKRLSTELEVHSVIP